ncbi:sperm-associated antigen 5 isoform X3 [Hypanus sabinus]|uniref:sperm-associated antigen 5 isoform X3 n=1 Tax=Hypanus sabinus TaxID=79690 RepID=UPI0028C447A7|nr:sperm-associated antigen 5 isoform X3 [Hypanus sabinus]
MFGERQSVKSSSVENDGQRPSTPSRKCGRVPLQEVLPQCSAQRDIRSSSRVGSSLTPLLRGLHLEDGFLPVSTLVYEDVCRNIFVEEEEAVCTPWLRDRIPLAAPTAGSLSDTSSLPSGASEPAASEGPSSPRVNHGNLPRGTCDNAVRTIVTETREDPKLSVTAESVQQGTETAVTVAAVREAGCPPTPAAGVSLSNSGPGAEPFDDSNPGSEPLALHPPPHPAPTSPSGSVRARGDGEASPANEEGMRLGKRKRLCSAGEGEGLNVDEGGQCVQLTMGGEQAGVRSGDGAAWRLAETQENPAAILAVHTGAVSPPPCVSGPTDLQQPVFAVTPVEGRVPVQLGRAQVEEEGEGQVVEIEDDEERAEEEGEAQVETGPGRVLGESSVQTEVSEETGTVQTEVEKETGTVQTEVGEETGTVQTEVEKETGTVQTEVEKETGTVQTEVFEETGTVQTEVEKETGTVQTEVGEETGTVQTEVEKETGTVQTEVSEETGTVQTEVEKETGTVQTEVGEETGTVQTEVEKETGTVQTEVGEETGTVQTEVEKETGTVQTEVFEEPGTVQTEVEKETGTVQTEVFEEPGTVQTEVEQETGSVQTEVEQETGSVQTEVEQETGSVQTEVEQETVSVQTEVFEEPGTVQTEMEQETGSVQTEVFEETGSVQTEVEQETGSVQTEDVAEVQTEEAVDGAEEGTELGMSPLPPPASCALTCLIHPANAQTPADTWKLLAAQLGTRRVTCRDVSTGITPLGSHCVATCMTPVSLAEDSGRSTTDSAVLTDSLLWNFNLEKLQMVPRGELERRLETTLIITEVLSSQMSELSRSKGLHRCVGPADQREAFTQTSCTQAPQLEERYQQLYLEQAARLRELELGLQQCRQLHSTISTFQHQQNSLQKEVEDSLSAADSACEEMQRERERMMEQLQDARQLARESTRTLGAMAQATSEAREEAAAMKSQAAEAEWRRVNMHQELENSKGRLREAVGTVKQLTAEKQQLNSGLAALTKELVEVEQDRDRLMKENSCYFVELATAEAALKLSEATLAERQERLQASEERNKEIDSLQETVQSLRREKECAEGALTESRARILSLTQSLQSRNEELQDLSDVRAQAALISDNCEFLEQELKICREQLAETEGQLSEQMRILHSRNLQCEELRAQRDRLQSELDTVKIDAREMLMEMGEQMSQTTVNIMDMESQMEAASRTAETYLKIWQQDLFRMVGEDRAEPRTPALQSDQQAAAAEEEARSCPGPEHQGAPRCDLRSEQSAFAPIQPASTDTAGGEDTLLVRVTRARAALGRLLDLQSQAESALQRQVKALRLEIVDGREQQNVRSSQKQLEMHSLQDRVAELEAENRQLARDLQAHVKTKCDMEETLSNQKQTIVKFHEMLDSNLEEHTQYLAMEQEVVELRRQLQQLETETSTLRQEFAKLQTPGDAPGKGWLQEKVELQHQVRKLRGAYVQKDSDMQQLREKMIRHRTILEENNQKAEAEVAKLDQMIEHVRNTLHSVPEVVSSSAELKGLLLYLGDDLGA